MHWPKSLEQRKKKLRITEQDNDNNGLSCTTISLVGHIPLYQPWPWHMFIVGFEINGSIFFMDMVIGLIWGQTLKMYTKKKSVPYLSWTDFSLWYPSVVLDVTVGSQSLDHG